MSDNEAPVADGGAGLQPASGPLDEATARWYVEYTSGQFQAFERDGHWYLHLPSAADTECSVGAGDG